MATYTYKSIIEPNPGSTTVNGINNLGQVSGSFVDTNGNYNGFVENTDGTYVTTFDSAGLRTFVQGANGAGYVFGRYLTLTNGVVAGHGFVEINGAYTTIDYPQATNTSVNGVNNSGEVVGGYSTATNTFGFTEMGGQFTQVAFPGATLTSLFGVNDSGELVGVYRDSNNVFHGFTDIGGSFATIDVPGAASTRVLGVNNNGDLVGSYLDSSNVTHGFIDKNGVFQTIDTPGATSTSVTGINNAGEIVGTSNGSGYANFEGTPDCFVSGTRILTGRGEIAVEALVVGDLAITCSGAAKPICWLAHRTIDCRSRAGAADARPVRVAAGAFGDGKPARDLYLSPGHPVLVGADDDGTGGHLVPIMCLINGTTIARQPSDTITYWHVELEDHDILLAEGLPAESYIDLGSRAWFAGDDGALCNPDLVLAGMPGRCRPVAISGALVEAERRRLDTVFAMRLAIAAAWPNAEDGLFEA